MFRVSDWGMSVSEQISPTRFPNFTKFPQSVACGRGSVLLRRRCNTLCTSGLWMTLCLPITSQEMDSRSPEVARFDKPHMTSHWLFVVTVCLYLAPVPRYCHFQMQCIHHCLCLCLFTVRNHRPSKPFYS